MGGLDLFEDEVVNRPHDFSGQEHRPLGRRQGVFGPSVVFPRTLAFEGHELFESGVVHPVQDVLLGNVKPLEVFLGEVNSSSGAVCADVTQDIGQLKGLAEIGASEELVHHQRDADNTPQCQQAHGREIILVDDGLATGSTMHAAVAAIKKQNPKRIVVAVPVAAQRTCDEFKHEVDEIICLKSPPSFDAVGLWYENFSQLTDEDVRDLLRRASQSSAAGSDRGARVA